jgi:Uma2 family endonuclease
MKTLENLETSLNWYFELHPEEEDRAETYHHMDLGDYLRQVLSWYYRFTNHLILKNQLVFADASLYTSPDIAVIKDVNLTKSQIKKLISWKIDPPTRFAPAVAIEISSYSNWDKDIELDKLPKRYADLGVKEYFAYDPEGYWQENVRLKGWQNVNGQMQPLKLNKGKIWSVELNCYVAADNSWLWFEDKNGKTLLTKAEAEEEARKAECERGEAEAQARELERVKAEKMAAKLREMHIDPDTL